MPAKPRPFKPIHIAQSNSELQRTAKALGAEVEKLYKMNEHYRRVLWMLIHDAGGELSVDQDAYLMTISASESRDFVFKMEPDAKAKKVFFRECDDKGEPVSRIIRI
jgi:hypothetical protein